MLRDDLRALFISQCLNSYGIEDIQKRVFSTLVARIPRILGLETGIFDKKKMLRNLISWRFEDLPEALLIPYGSCGKWRWGQRRR
ncbi:MAG: hypothetical protein ACE5K2_02845 [Candidatus Zixiibacteriota bacterium]